MRIRNQQHTIIPADTRNCNGLLLNPHTARLVCFFCRHEKAADGTGGKGRLYYFFIDPNCLHFFFFLLVGVFYLKYARKSRRLGHSITSKVMAHHFSDQLLKTRLCRVPAQLVLCLLRIPPEIYHICRTVKFRGYLD